MTDSQVRPWVGKSVRATLDDGRVVTGTLHADDAHGHGHAHYVIVSAGASGRQEVIHGADAFAEIEAATG